MKELQKRAYALYLGKDTSNPPKQHIFWVDDVWFHGDSKENKKCHFAGGDSSIDATISEQNKLQWNSHTEYTVSSSLTPAWNPLQPFPVLKVAAAALTSTATTSEDAASDKTGSAPPGLTEDELIPILAQFAFDNDYGLVLCSFEFFFLHSAQIAEHCEHAAIFDVRHQAAAGKTELINAWGTEMGTPPVVGEFNSVCGYRLYLELAKCCQSHPNGFSMKDHAFFLTSRDGFHTNYLNQVIAMITAGALSKAVHLLRPLVLSKSKPTLGGGSALPHSLELFNSSFRNALSWEMKELALWKDMKQLWERPRASEEWGHVQAANISALVLNSTTWLPPSDNEKARCLQAMYLAVWREGDGNALAVSAFHAFLDHAADSETVIFTPPTGDLGGKLVSLPSRPGILSVLAIARFLRSLTQKKENEFRATPSVSWSRDAQKVKLQIRLPSAQTGVDALKREFPADKSTTGSTPALRQAAAAQLLMLDAATSKDPTKLGDISYLGTSLREKLCQDADHEQLRLPKALPSFDKDAITFWFHVVEPPKAG